MNNKLLVLPVLVCILLSFSSVKKIPACYLSFEGNEKYILVDSIRKSPLTKTNFDFTIAKNKKISVELTDTYEGEFENSNEESNLTIEIKLSDNKKLKDYVLAHYKWINEENKKSRSMPLQADNFNINGVNIIGFTAKDIRHSNLGNYAIFPSNNMVIFLQFMPQESSILKSITAFKAERDELIRSYLVHVERCKKK